MRRLGPRVPRPKRTDLFEARLEARGAVKANGRRVPKKGMPQCSEAGMKTQIRSQGYVDAWKVIFLNMGF